MTDLITIHTEGLKEGIRCALCRNPMKTDKGCDGGCDINENTVNSVIKVITEHTEDKYRWRTIEDPLDMPNIGDLVLVEFKNGKYNCAKYDKHYTAPQFWTVGGKARVYSTVAKWKYIEPSE